MSLTVFYVAARARFKQCLQSPNSARSTRMTAQRLLTTHAGSLPRPKTLVHLLAAQAGGEEVNPATLGQGGRGGDGAASSPSRSNSGVDIINDGEVGRESFFTYVQHRMTGFGGRGTRAADARHHDVSEFPAVHFARDGGEREREFAGAAAGGRRCRLQGCRCDQGGVRAAARRISTGLRRSRRARS